MRLTFESLPDLPLRLEGTRRQTGSGELMQPQTQWEWNPGTGGVGSPPPTEADNRKKFLREEKTGRNTRKQQLQALPSTCDVKTF